MKSNNKQKNPFQGMYPFILLWATQAFSTLGSSITSYALVIWSYQQTGSALSTALLSICSYAPYVLLSIFAGAMSDRWNKKRTMLICDTFAAVCTAAVWFLLYTGQLKIAHLYLLNALNGLMNTVQQPASDVAVSLLTPKNQYQRASAMRSFSNSLVTLLTPVIAASMLAFWGMNTVIAFDLITFGTAFFSLAFLIHIPENQQTTAKKSLLSSTAEGLSYLRKNRGILDLILFLAAINLTASIYEAALTPMLLSRNGGSQIALGTVNACTGLANIAGSILAAFCPAPKSRVRIICASLMFSMSTENFLLAFGKTPVVWCLGAVLGWLFIPVMNANMDVLFRTQIPVEMQGRVYSARNTLQFFTIPVGYLLGGICVDKIFEPLMALQPAKSPLIAVFGSGKGSGAALLFFITGFIGVFTCLLFQRDRHIWDLEKHSPKDR